MEEFQEKDKSVREGGGEDEGNGKDEGSGKEVPEETVEQQDDPEPEGGKASGQSGLDA